ncbi:hypothetical protein CHS0354_009776 [Potamilus streckersoni]|uniref:TIR domain-containing protein n=1 Tax=Potamilus streckersoni TaxID=2493646 RepID=A0AAE0SUQ4_9BIVA|nr:hypothetical protein CHS0354_009776 [Potamilus streckersoni]
MGKIIFSFGSFIATLILFLMNESETIQVYYCLEECKDIKCPENCICTDISVNCHDRNVTNVPRIPCGIQYLNLSNCSISNLTIIEISNLVCSFETLTFMNLSDCKISLLEEDVFTNLTQLEVVDLSSNKIGEQLQSLQRGLGSLNSAPLRELNLDHIRIRNGGLRDIFKYFSGSHLTYLSMRENQIIEFEDKVLENFTKLLHLDLHGNWINKITLSSGIQTLEMFNLSHNQINIFPPNFCDNKTGQSRYSNLTNLDLSWNQIIVPSSSYWNCLKTLKTFNLSGNDIEDITNNDSFTNLTSLETLIISEMRTTLRKIRSEAIKSDSLQHLDLRNNRLDFEEDKEVAEDIFRFVPNLKSLDISHNKLGRVGATKLFALFHLEKLIMRHVNLLQLPDNFLGNFANLTYLDLSSNKIENFSPNAFQNASALQFLNLSDNVISNFPAPPVFPATLKSLRKFDFAHNYFQCDCEIVKLQKWINKVLSDPDKKNLLSRYPDDYWCYTPHPMYHVLLKDAVPTHCKYSNYQFILSVVCSAVICLVVAVVLVVMYVYRWKIKLLLHNMRQRRRDGYCQLTRSLEYNTYLVYAEKDSAWVIHELMKELEEARYNVYIRDRYSVPGVARCDEIVDNIYKSKTVILVLSKNFMACQWCNYQLNVAQARAVKLGPHFMIPVFLEGIDTSRMTRSLKHLFRTLKPIEWARQSTKNRLFWSELKTALDAETSHEFEETGYQSCAAEYAYINTDRDFIHSEVLERSPEIKTSSSGDSIASAIVSCVEKFAPKLLCNVLLPLGLITASGAVFGVAHNAVVGNGFAHIGVSSSKRAMVTSSGGYPNRKSEKANNTISCNRQTMFYVPLKLTLWSLTKENVAKDARS